MGVLAGIIAILCIFIGVPAIVFSFIFKSLKGKREIEKLKYQKEILELELAKEDAHIKLLEEENKKLDKIIYDS